MELKTAFKNRGFTLIELLVFLLVVFILVGLGYANFRKYAQKQALWAVARQIEGDLHLAQSYAMSGKDASSCISGTYLYGYQLLSLAIVLIVFAVFAVAHKVPLFIAMCLLIVIYQKDLR